jgi:HAD superfamily hydrolase (TIGR01509 family)
MPGAVALVRALAAASVPLAVASSSPHDDIGPSLVAVGLDALLPVRVSGFDVARMKPAPDVYLRAIDLLGLSPSACVAVEDAQAGVEAAKAAGLSCVAVPNRYTLGRHDFRAADAVVASLETVTAELLETLALRRK